MNIHDLVVENKELPAYAWPGGYPIFYVDYHNAILCPGCANDSFFDPDEMDEFKPIAWDVNWEDEYMYCDQCNEKIESAYGDEEDDNE